MAIFTAWLNNPFGFDLATADIRLILIDEADDIPTEATDDFLDDILVAAREEVSANVGSKTFGSVGTGAWDFADTTFSAAAGDPIEGVLAYQHTGTDSTSRLIVYDDTAAALPVTLNGGDVIYAPNASGMLVI